MEWHVLIFGSVDFPKGGLARWRSEKLTELDDWKGELGGGLDGRGKSVKAMLAQFYTYPEDQGQIELATTATRVTVSGFLKDDAFRAHATEVLATFRAASGRCWRLWFSWGLA